LDDQRNEILRVAVLLEPGVVGRDRLIVLFQHRVGVAERIEREGGVGRPRIPVVDVLKPRDRLLVGRPGLRRQHPLLPRLDRRLIRLEGRGVQPGRLILRPLPDPRRHAPREADRDQHRRRRRDRLQILRDPVADALVPIEQRLRLKAGLLDSLMR
jgi:hypothetical protein